MAGAAVIVARELAGAVAARTGRTFGEPLATFPGSVMDRLTFRHPLYDRDSLAVLGDYVTLEAGTGVVHTAPGHGADDYRTGVEYGLEILAPLDAGGHFVESVPIFAGEHVQMAGGFVVGQATEHLVKLDLEFHSLDTLAGLVVAQRNGVAVRLGDIAELEDGLTDNRQLARFNGETTVGLGVVKVANANTVAIAERIKQRLAGEIEPQLPPGMRISIVSNDATFILEIVNSLKEHLVEGTLLASLVVWFFLRSLRSTLIVALAIPVSLMGAIAVIHFFGYTLNSLTMLALLLLIGVVVDDAIVVLENIFRHREDIDPDPVSAAANGSREVVFAVIAATLSLVSIFAPVIFLQGVLGQFFRSFAVVVTFGVLVSLFVSLTLTPMLCSRYLKVEKQHGRIYHLLDGILGGMDRLYVRLLDASLRHRWLVVALTVAIVAGSSFFFINIGKTFTPEEDEGRFRISLRTPLGSSIDYTDGKLREVEAVLNNYPEVRTEFALIGLGSAGQVNQGTVALGANNVLSNASSLVLNGGSLFNMTDAAIGVLNAAARAAAAPTGTSMRILSGGRPSARPSTSVSSVRPPVCWSTRPMLSAAAVNQSAP